MGPQSPEAAGSTSAGLMVAAGGGRGATPWLDLLQHDLQVTPMHGVSTAYSTTSDWSQAHDLADELPDKLHELQRLLLIEAARYNVLPLDDRFVETHDPGDRRPAGDRHRHSQLLFPGMRSLKKDCVLNIRNRSHAITAQLLIPDGGASLFVDGEPAGWTGPPATCSPSTRPATSAPTPARGL